MTKYKSNKLLFFLIQTKTVSKFSYLKQLLLVEPSIILFFRTRSEVEFVSWLRQYSPPRHHPDPWPVTCADLGSLRHILSCSQPHLIPSHPHCFTAKYQLLALIIIMQSTTTSHLSLPRMRTHHHSTTTTTNHPQSTIIMGFRAL